MSAEPPEMIRRIAQVIHDADHSHATYEEIAREVIGVLMEPTKAMCLANGDGPATSRRIWKEMLRASLE